VKEKFGSLTRLSSFTVIVHRDERWRIVLADEETDTTGAGEGEDFGRAWDDLRGKRPIGTVRSRLFARPRRVTPSAGTVGKSRFGNSGDT
jgi:hypothetical protein